MNGGVPPYFNMFGAAGMPQLSQAQQTQHHQNKSSLSQQPGTAQVTPPNNPFMNGAAHVSLAQAHQGAQNPFFSNGNMPPPMTIPQNTPQPANPFLLANTAFLASGNGSNMNNTAQQTLNGQQQMQQQQQPQHHQQPPNNPNAMFLANAAHMQQQQTGGNGPSHTQHPTTAQQQAVAFARMAVENVGVDPTSNNSDSPPPQKPKAIMHPHDHDVMCGRGGLTNFHRGNVWYRRLVKCNRPLYRESAKYTKLLVSKAIVQAVHSQNPPVSKRVEDCLA